MREKASGEAHGRTSHSIAASWDTARNQCGHQKGDEELVKEREVGYGRLKLFRSQAYLTRRSSIRHTAGLSFRFLFIPCRHSDVAVIALRQCSDESPSEKAGLRSKFKADRLVVDLVHFLVPSCGTQQSACQSLLQFAEPATYPRRYNSLVILHAIVCEKEVQVGEMSCFLVIQCGISFQYFMSRDQPSIMNPSLKQRICLSSRKLAQNLP